MDVSSFQNLELGIVPTIIHGKVAGAWGWGWLVDWLDTWYRALLSKGWGG